MNIANQTKILSGLFGMTDSVTLIAESGFDCIDVTFSEPDLECWLKDTSYNKQAAELKKHAEALGVCFHQAHAPTPSDGADEAYNSREKLGSEKYAAFAYFLNLFLIE